MEFLSEKFALKSPPSKSSDFYMGAGGALEHVMETLDNESFYSKASAGKCVQAFGPLPRAEHHVRLERASPCQDSGGESPARAAAPVRTPRCGDGRGRLAGGKGRGKGERGSRRARGRGRQRNCGAFRSSVLAAANFAGQRKDEAPGCLFQRGAPLAVECGPLRVLESLYLRPGRKLIGRYMECN